MGAALACVPPTPVSRSTSSPFPGALSLEAPSWGARSGPGNSSVTPWPWPPPPVWLPLCSPPLSRSHAVLLSCLSCLHSQPPPAPVCAGRWVGEHATQSVPALGAPGLALRQLFVSQNLAHSRCPVNAY